MTVLPEIVDHILGFLHSDKDYTDLETCSHIFPQLVERHLYSRITFFTGYKVPRWPPKDTSDYIVDSTRFSRTLIDHPHVASYVRSVDIILGRELPLAPELAIISSNLSNLSQIKSITLSSIVRHSWNLLDHEFRTALHNSIRLPSIKEIAISDIISFPLDVFEDCKNLERLQLFCQYAGGEAVSTSSYPRLCSFSIDEYDLAMSRIVSWMRSNTLHSLELHMANHRGLHNFRTLIEACASTLVNLELDILSNVNEYSTDTILPNLQLPVLEQMIIRNTVALVSRTFSEPSLLAPFSLSTVRPLSTIHLYFHLNIYIRIETLLLGFDWSGLAAFLVLPVFHHPIELSIDGMGNLPFDIMSSFNQNSDLKRLHEKGGLVIKLGHG